MSGGILGNNNTIIFYENAFSFFDLLYKKGGTEKNKEIKRRFNRIFFPNSPKQSRSECTLMLTAAHKETDCLSYSAITAQHIYCTNTVQTVQSATELYLK